MNRLSATLPFVAAMALVVVASNILVQFPVQGMVGGIALADILTWGAFTYPFAFLVTDLANRRYGPGVARHVVFVGFMIAVVCSIVVPPLLYAIGLIDYGDERRPAGAHRRRLRRGVPRRASCSTSPSSTGCAGRAGGAPRCSPRWPARCSTPRSSSRSPSRRCSPSSAPEDGFALEPAPLLGVFGVEASRWMSWAIGDLSVKLVIAVFALIPYRLIAARWSQPGSLLPVHGEKVPEGRMRGRARASGL